MINRKKMKSKKFLIAVSVFVVLVVVLATGVFLFRPTTTEASCTKETATNPAPSLAETATDSTSESATSEPIVISYENGKFTPNCALIKSGQAVVFENHTDEDIEIGADPHPLHTGNNEISDGEFVLTIGPQEAVTVTLQEVGNHGYHNHLNSTATGTVIVE